VGFAVLAGGLGRILPQSFLPDEDQGYFFMNVELPPAASLERTNAVMRQVDAILKNESGIRYYNGASGYSILSQTSSSRNGVYFCQLRPYADRTSAALQSEAIVADVNRKMAALPDAQVFAFLPPAIPGVGQASGIDFFVQDHAGKTVDYLWQNTQKFLAAAKKRPELGPMNLLFDPATPQMFAAVDKDKVLRRSCGSAMLGSPPRTRIAMRRGATAVSPARCLLCTVFFAVIPFTAVIWALR
jgi:hydrophobic/amphiphilic exporter-1 (mainly G- bacteria), HAE1 family